ncbi:DUF5602 domain-containing protein [Gloeocapsa sp. PCC 73106]|uniref:DUF5602 domain-containing protein n=1 Tax=Gloeocapsa sp. PCC 73106 TaxID=102232 RepID=UPI0002ABA620|nr:DUF5602 domain-containing protein [Gloeocapsa sp. PCC 73106]ELR96677.1 hypothetical protein GLO73106DRAFT_00004740 [Gloeocapsa sp. PCC 73106]
MDKANKNLTALTAFIALAVTTAVLALNFKPTVQIYGEQEQLGDGVIQTYVTLNEQKYPTEIGVMFTQASLSGLPTTPIEYELSLPSEALASTFRYVIVSWNPQGHEPIGIYDVPHFDFHFYSLSSEARQKITAMGEDLVRVSKPPLKEFMPFGYIPEGTPPAPKEGNHWINSYSSEFQGKAFTHTLIYGTYDGAIVFIEPMLTKALLETKPKLKELINLPQEFAQTGYYPTAYSVRYNQAQQVYTVSLDNLTLRYPQ